ncbi:MAG: hypothetical protein ACLQDY_00240 [Streptosporangiaceae bacterium]
MKIITAAAVAATCCLSLVLSAPAAQASTVPRAAPGHAYSSADPAGTIAPEPCYHRNSPPSCWSWVIRPAHLQLEVGPSFWTQHTHWSRWGSRNAYGYGYLWAEDVGKWTFGRVSLHLYRPRMLRIRLRNGQVIRRPGFTRLHLGASSYKGMKCRKEHGRLYCSGGPQTLHWYSSPQHGIGWY